MWGVIINDLCRFPKIQRGHDNFGYQVEPLFQVLYHPHTFNESLVSECLYEVNPSC